MTRRCWTGGDLDQAVADGRLTQGDADELRDFAELLRRLGKRAERRSAEQAAALRDYVERHTPPPPAPSGD